jgi:hypothetical protein
MDDPIDNSQGSEVDIIIIAITDLNPRAVIDGKLVIELGPQPMGSNGARHH